LHLKSITLKGFKSFAQTTNLILEPGITCVVGPNGSGKSNIVDALAWVMGEQGVKTLRGGKMEDVIFAGTETKGPLGRAEVQLTIDNADGALPIEYSEVTISRVLFRNGASEYAINGESCRLLDVQELLSDTGLGREMHVIVGQGQLDTVLRANPDERRAFIEEAAGILKYRRRKEKTERKLEAMQANLTRLQDLIAELRRNLKPLGRQADIARQAQEIAAIAREAKAKLLSHQIRALRAQLEESQKGEAERKAEATAAKTALDEARSGIAEIENQLVSSELDALRSQLFSLESTESRLRNLQNLAAQKIALLENPVSVARDQELAALKLALDAATSSLAELQGELGLKESVLRDLETGREQAAAKLSAFDAEQIRARSETETAQKKIAAVENEMSVLESKLAGVSNQALSLEATKEQTLARAQELATAKSQLQPELETSDDALRLAYEKAQQTEINLRQSLETARDQLHALERERDAVAAKHAALGLTLEQSDGAVDIKKANLKGLSGLLAEHISIDEGFETAIAVALGPLSDALIAGSQDQAVAGLRFLKGNQLGRVEFLVSSGKPERGKAETVSGLPSAASVVSAPREVLAQLKNIYLAADLDQAQAALASGKLAGCVVITRDGDYLSDYLVRGGGTKKPSKLELTAERDQAAKQLEKLAKQIESSSKAVADKRDALTAGTESVITALSSLQQHDAELAARAERVGRVIAQADSAQSEVARIDRDLEQLAQVKQQLEKDLQIAKESLSQLPKLVSLEQHSDQRAELAADLEKARALELEVRISVGTIKERLAGASREEATLLGRIKDGEAAIQKDLEAEKLRQGQLESAKASLEQLPKVLALTEKLSAGIRQQLRELEAQRGSRLERLSILRTQSLSLEQKLSDMNQGVHVVELKAAELRLNLANISERVQTELGLNADSLLAETPEGSEEREELEKALRISEGKLAQLGAFNPLALEEFSALEERHKYLSDQLEDLNKARVDLAGIIKDLDSKMQHIFAAAFEDTKREFEKIFPILFPGGAGSISLTDSDDLLSTGVEVSVRPAGKRIERMSLLSGGERSLAAVALLIAIFKARPSPFYVLDEVEAALDDSNLGRLLTVIESLRDSSQLIIVTHQKRTMEIADALYGVSMRQDGITQVVGQKLAKAS
jgi:chromosome segregation protein